MADMLALFLKAVGLLSTYSVLYYHYIYSVPQVLSSHHDPASFVDFIVLYL